MQKVQKQTRSIQLLHQYRGRYLCSAPLENKHLLHAVVLKVYLLLARNAKSLSYTRLILLLTTFLRLRLGLYLLPLLN